MRISLDHLAALIALGAIVVLSLWPIEGNHAESNNEKSKITENH